MYDLVAQPLFKVEKTVSDSRIHCLSKLMASPVNTH